MSTAGSVPDKEMVSCLDPELPGTGIRKKEVRGLACFTLGKRVIWNPAEMGKR
jgi:hypothetical protein